MDVRKLEELYDGLDLNSTHYLGNALNMTVFGTSYTFSKLREKVCLFSGPMCTLCDYQHDYYLLL